MAYTVRHICMDMVTPFYPHLIKPFRNSMKLQDIITCNTAETLKEKMLLQRIQFPGIARIDSTDQDR